MAVRVSECQRGAGSLRGAAPRRRPATPRRRAPLCASKKCIALRRDVQRDLRADCRRIVRRRARDQRPRAVARMDERFVADRFDEFDSRGEASAVGDLRRVDALHVFRTDAQPRLHDRATLASAESAARRPAPRPPRRRRAPGRGKIHRGIAEKPRDEEIHRPLVDLHRRVDLLNDAASSTTMRCPSVIASTWSCVT